MGDINKFMQVILLVPEISKPVSKMYEYHVTYGPYKKLIKSESNIAKDIHDPIKKAFSLDSDCSLHLQYWNKKHDDWVDCESLDKVNEDTKLNVWQVARGVEEFDFASLNAPSSSNAELHDSSPTEYTIPANVFEDCSLIDEHTYEQTNSGDIPYVPGLPQFPPWLQKLLNAGSPQCKVSKCRRAIVDTLFNDMFRHGCYPKSSVFRETSRALVEAYPILKDKEYPDALPYESWVQRLRDKFKKYRTRHPELCDAEEVERMRAKFGNKRERDQSNKDNGRDGPLTYEKRMKIPLLSEWAEDEFSINKNVKTLQEECNKDQPDDQLIQDTMQLTFEYRIKYISTHSVVETLECFPPLRQTNELLNEAARLGISKAMLSEFLIQKNSRLSELAKRKNLQNKKLSELLAARAECAYTEDNELAFAFLLIPCFMQEEFPLLYAGKNSEIAEPVIVYRESTNLLNNSFYELFLDKQLVTKAEDLVTAATLWFSLFWIFDIGYSKNHLKLLSFLDTFVFKKCTLKPVRQSVRTFFNLI